MRSLTYYVAVTIDGFIAGPQHETEFFPTTDDVFDFIRTEYPETLPAHARAQLGVTEAGHRFDTLIMGRTTYEPALKVGIASPYPHLRQFVVSTTLGAADDPEVRVIDGDPVAAVRALKRSEGGGIWLAGGGQVAGALLDEIDELVVKLYPVVAGDGVPMFRHGFAPTRFTLVETRALAGGTVVLTYRRS
jgi:dihydrofolate reductase